MEGNAEGRCGLPSGTRLTKGGNDLLTFLFPEGCGLRDVLNPPTVGVQLHRRFEYGVGIKWSRPDAECSALNGPLKLAYVAGPVVAAEKSDSRFSQRA